MSAAKPAVGPGSQPKGALYAKTIKHDFAWKLRLTHPDRADIRLEWAGRPIVFDPVEIADGDVVVLTGPAPERLRGTVAALAAGKHPDVLADEAILAWLRGHGTLGEATLGLTSTSQVTVDGVTVRSMPYVATSPVRPLNHYLKASIIAFRPSRSLGILRAGREAADRGPVASVAPRIFELTVPGVGRLVHLDLALTRLATPAWIASAADYAGADWVLAGCAYGESEAVATMLPGFAGKHVLVTELINTERRAVGLPVEGVTPLRDRLHADGLPAHVFATQASYRFE